MHDFAQKKLPGKGSLFLHDVVDRAGEEDDVADVLHARHIHDETVEPEPEPAVRHAAEEAQVEVLLVGGDVHVPCLHRGKQFVVVRLSFAAADDLADAGNEEIGRRHRLAVGVLLHIEGLDLLRVVGDEHGALEDDFGEVFFVLGLKVAAPVDGVLELDVRLLQDGNGVRACL